MIHRSMCWETVGRDPPLSLEVFCARFEDEAHELCEDDVRVNRAMAQFGADIVPHGANLLHHCNTGALATVDYGTALGVIYGASPHRETLRFSLLSRKPLSVIVRMECSPWCAECHAQGKEIHVYVDETRPRLQGARLTAWELTRAKVPMHLVVDGASGLLMRTKRVDMVLFGADRVAANGDVANKIGTYNLAVVAHENGVPCYAVVPTSTIDLGVATGEDIIIEERGAEEVTSIQGCLIAPEDVPVFNPAFDVTPYKHLTGIITEEGICYPPFHVSLRQAKENAELKRRETWEAKLAAVRSGEEA